MGNLDNCPPVVFNWNHDGKRGLEVLPVVVDYLHIPPWNGRLQIASQIRTGTDIHPLIGKSIKQSFTQMMNQI